MGSNAPAEKLPWKPPPGAPKGMIDPEKIKPREEPMPIWMQQPASQVYQDEFYVEMKNYVDGYDRFHHPQLPNEIQGKKFHTLLDQHFIEMAFTNDYNCRRTHLDNITEWYGKHQVKPKKDVVYNKFTTYGWTTNGVPEDFSKPMPGQTCYEEVLEEIRERESD